jgi:hypothetical protein
VPLLGFNGRRSELLSRLRSAAALLVDRRWPIDRIRDTLERRGDLMTRQLRISGGSFRSSESIEI